MSAAAVGKSRSAAPPFSASAGWAAGTVIAIVPTMILFAFIQKYMASGLTAGAVKG